MFLLWHCKHIEFTVQLFISFSANTSFCYAWLQPSHPNQQPPHQRSITGSKFILSTTSTRAQLRHSACSLLPFQAQICHLSSTRHAAVGQPLYNSPNCSVVMFTHNSLIIIHSQLLWYGQNVVKHCFLSSLGSVVPVWLYFLHMGLYY